MKLAKRVDTSKRESIIPDPHSLLQSRGEGPIENFICSALKLQHGNRRHGQIDPIYRHTTGPN